MPKFAIIFAVLSVIFPSISQKHFARFMGGMTAWFFPPASLHDYQTQSRVVIGDRVKLIENSMSDLILTSSEAKRTFPLGKIVMTTEALHRVHLGDMSDGLTRHAKGDWGDVRPEEKEDNNNTVATGYRLFSVYHDRKGVTFWIITEADRKSTTVLLPDDY